MPERLNLVRLHVEIETNKRTAVHDSAHDDLDDAGAALAEFLAPFFDPTTEEPLICSRCGHMVDQTQHHTLITREIASREDHVTAVHDGTLIAALCTACAPRMAVRLEEADHA